MIQYVLSSEQSSTVLKFSKLSEIVRTTFKQTKPADTSITNYNNGDGDNNNYISDEPDN